MIGTVLNQYRITAQLGVGGMGEVYRARDTKLNRDVAIKFLAGDFADNADRLRRFEQEAKTLAALNHPNILTIHDAGVHAGAPYLVSELLRGGTLREEMSRGALPARKATDYGLQIAQGLAVAHGKGIIHRDLKPENIFVTNDGRVEILDFGLAKLKEVSSFEFRVSSSADSEAPTAVLSTAVESTEPGLVLGTPAYMSPEQVRGEPADHRADIFAFGTILYEIISGQRAFKRDTPVETMNAILTTEPPELAGRTPDLPPMLERVVRRCLEKQPENRFQSAKDLAFAIENAGAATSSLRSAMGHRAQSPFSFERVLPWALAALCLAGLLVVSLQHKFPSGSIAGRRSGALLRKFEIQLPPQTSKGPRTESLTAVLSPDGLKFAYADVDGLWLRWLDRTGPPVRLVGEGTIISPFWSPTSTELAYFDDQKLFRVSINAGRSTLVAATPESATPQGAGGAWLEGDRIVFFTGGSGLREVPAQGGQLKAALALREGEVDFHSASALPGARGVVLLVHGSQGPNTIALWKASGERKDLLQLPDHTIEQPVYSPSGHVVFQDRTEASSGLWAFRFSLEKLERTGEPFRVSDIGAFPSVSTEKTLLFSVNESDRFSPRRLVWVDRTGNISGTLGPFMRGLVDPHLSPDGRRVSVTSRESSAKGMAWIIDVESGGAMPFLGSRRGTPEREIAYGWTDQGRNVVFARESSTNFNLMTKPLDGTGTEERLWDSGLRLSSSGKYVLGARQFENGRLTWGYVPLESKDRKMIPVPETFQRIHAWELSPDDRLLAYVSNESGQTEVYVVDFPAFANRRVVSRGGGRYPKWHPKGTELFYLSNEGSALTSCRLKAAGAQIEPPEKVFGLPESIFHFGSLPNESGFYDVSPDGERFLMLQKIEDNAANAESVKSKVMIVQNWFEEFRAKND